MVVLLKELGCNNKNLFNIFLQFNLTRHVKLVLINNVKITWVFSENLRTIDVSNKQIKLKIINKILMLS
jgi:hypothetical protein